MEYITHDTATIPVTDEMESGAKISMLARTTLGRKPFSVAASAMDIIWNEELPRESMYVLATMEDVS